MTFARYKMCIFGDGGVGKTTLVNRYISGKYSEDFKMTIGVDFYTKSLMIEDINVMLQIWDFAGERQFNNLLPNYIIGASGGVYMYDISRFSSLTNMDNWLKVLKNVPDMKDQYFPILLVGGKSDLDTNGKRVIEKEYAFEYGKKHNFFDFIECSSKTGENVGDIFNKIARKLLNIKGLL